MLEQLRDPKYGTHSFVDVNGVRLHYVSRGTGSRLVLFLHGFPEFWYSWHRQMEFMAAQGFRCVAVDMRGYNESSKPLGVNSYHRRKLIEDVRQLVLALGFQRCTLVAHDWGGIVAWDVVRKHADLVDRLVILNSPHPVLFQRNMNLKQLTKVRDALPCVRLRAGAHAIAAQSRTTSSFLQCLGCQRHS